MSSDNIKTAKLGSQYETLYYYKQKVVNWEFIAPSQYISLIHTANITNTSLSIVDTALYKTNTSVSIDITRYITEKSYKEYTTYYRFTITNTMLDTVPMLLVKYYNTDDTYTIDKTVNETLDSTTPSISFEETFIGTNNKTAISSTDNIKIDIYSQFPKGTYIHENNIPTDGLFCEMETISATLYSKSVSCVSSTMIQHKDITIVPIILENTEVAEITTKTISTINTAGQCLPIATYVASNIETINVQKLTPTFISLSTVNTAHVEHTYIVT